MKNIILILILLAGFSVAVNAQSAKSKKKQNNAKREQALLKDNLNKDISLTIDNFFPAHGEKGHNCTSACATTKSARGQIQFNGSDCKSCINSNYAFARKEKGNAIQINAKRSNSAH